ncbi:PD-(D/E)XK nuclease family protein [Shimia sp. MIT1388]|uniref:PD-(D/E)XK nuclease family protein n=1 Tax=Shimia sp. MIT1388 TaxID=3096992 RepID=UPI00399AC88B
MRITPLQTISPITGASRTITDTLLQEVYLAPATAPFALSEVLRDRPAPWSESFAHAPDATLRAVSSGFTALAQAVPSLDPKDIDLTPLPNGRAQDHLRALRDLWTDVGAPPEPVATWAHVVHCSADAALECLPVVQEPDCSFATPAETALAQALRGHHGTVAPTGTATSPVGPAHQASGALGHLQKHLGGKAAQTSPDESVRFLGLRDPQEEAEYAAAHVQHLLEKGHISEPSEAGVLAPAEVGYQSALREAFEHIGLPLAGLPPEGAERDTTRETLCNILALLENPDTCIAKASLSLSPHMPWPREIGRKMAREFTQRGWSRTAASLTPDMRAVFETLRPTSTAAQVKARLGVIAKAAPRLHLDRLIGELHAGLADPLDWRGLRRLAAPKPVDAQNRERFVEGVTLLDENALPWRSVRHLVVLGLNGSAFPRQPGTNPFFTEGEIVTIREKTGLALTGRRHKISRGLELFRRQLCTATEQTTFLVPALDMAGGRLSPSTAFSMMAYLLGATDPADLVEDVHTLEDKKQTVSLCTVSPIAHDARPELPASGQLDLQTNLLQLRRNDEGQALPQSPSRLERLITSPLAWLLEELGATDQTWAPDAPDVMVKGTLLHRVMETLFPAGTAVPSEATLTQNVGTALDEAISRTAPWMQDPAWALERKGLLVAAREAAIGWADFLQRSGADIVENEISLSGAFDGQPLTGNADSLLKLENGTVLIVDHKSGKSDKRRVQMQAGWDLQLALYREMLKTSPPENLGNATSSPTIGTAYHTFADSAVLVDQPGGTVDGAETITAESSAHALVALREALNQVGGGCVSLNQESDADTMQAERGVSPYALDNPFVSAFTLPSPEEDIQ